MKLFPHINLFQITYYSPLLKLTIIILLDVLIKNIWELPLSQILTSTLLLIYKLKSAKK